jgi:glycosyltransferase involved in cell wall biosynthesis
MRKVIAAVRSNWRDPSALLAFARRYVHRMLPTSELEISRRGTRMRSVLNSVDVLLAPSNFLREMYGRFGVQTSRIIYSDYGMNTAVIQKSVRTPSGRLVFGYIGTLLPTKGVHVLVEAFLKIPEGRAELRIFGPPANKYVQNYARMLEQRIGNRSDIRMLGEYQPQQLGEILAQLDAIVVPSIWHENSPLTIHEAFLAGTPVITSNIGGMAELVSDGVNGLHFAVNDSDDLSKKLLMLIENRDLVTRLSAAAPPIKSIEDNAHELEVMYKGLIRSATQT